MNLTTIKSICSIFVLGYCSAVSDCLAQIVPDNTVGTQVQYDTNTNGLTSDVVSGGTIKGNNLFHSFSEFSINTGRGIYFTNPDGITNILTRVTGAKASNINGVLGVLGNANLFFLNPNGIIFGTNASLETGGSFLATTANSINFADGTKFSAIDNTNPLLSISVPTGLNLNSNGTIQVNGIRTDTPTTNIGLSVALGKTLALVGGNISFASGLVTVASGRIEFGSVLNGTVSISPTSSGWSLGYDQVEKYGNIEFLGTNISTISTSNWDNNLAAIQVRGSNISLNEGSQIASLASGIQPGANIDIQASQSLNISGIDNSQQLSSRIFTSVAPDASAVGGNLLVTAPQIRITDGGRIETVSLGKGNAGNINVFSDTIKITGFSPYQKQADFIQPLNSGIDSANLGSGKGGNVEVYAKNITLLDGGFISTFSAPSATGSAGHIKISAAESIISKGTNELNPIFSSGIGAVSFGAGAGGNILVSTKKLDLQQGGAVQSSAYGSGKGGDITINATDSIYAVDDNPLLRGISSGVIASTFGFGNGGDIYIFTDKLQLYDGADITSFSSNQPLGGILLPGSGTGNAGNILVNALSSVEVIGVSSLAPETGTNLSSLTFGSGRSGDVKVSTRRLTVKDGGLISTTVSVGAFSLGVPAPGSGKGEGGNLTINASEKVEVIGTNKFLLTSSNIGTASLGSGSGGDTLVNTPQLIVQDGGRVGSLATATGNAGGIRINSDTVWVSGVRPDGRPSEISSNALISSDIVRFFYFLPLIPIGDTGQVEINTKNMLVNDGARISVQHDGTGNAGKISITAADFLSLNNQGSILATSKSGEGGDISIKTHLMQMRNSTITATAKNQGNGGNITIDAKAVVQLENSDIITNAFDGRGGNIQINTQVLLGGKYREKLTPQSDITASSQFGVNGVVNLNVPEVDINQGINNFTLKFVDTNTQLTNACTAIGENRFSISGRGGFPASPIQTLIGETIWQDFRNADNWRPNKKIHASKVNNDLHPVEAQGWVVDNKGEVSLITNSTSATPQHNSFSAPSCG